MPWPISSRTMNRDGASINSWPNLGMSISLADNITGFRSDAGKWSSIDSLCRRSATTTCSSLYTTEFVEGRNERDEIDMPECHGRRRIASSGHVKISLGSEIKSTASPYRAFSRCVETSYEDPQFLLRRTSRRTSTDARAPLTGVSCQYCSLMPRRRHRLTVVGTPSTLARLLGHYLDEVAFRRRHQEFAATA